MEASLLNFRKYILAFGFVLLYFVQANAQCTVSTVISYLSPGNYHAATTPTIPTDWEVDMYVEFGDVTSGFSHSGPATTYTGNHSYVANGTYIVTTSMFAYDPNDTSLNCTNYDYDTIVLTNYPCSIIANPIVYNQVGNTYFFNSGYNTANHGVSTIWEMRDSIGNILSSLNDTANNAFNYSFSNDGNYRVKMTAYAYDSITSTSCWDSVSSYLNVIGIQPSSCNALFQLWEDTLNPGQWYATNNSFGGAGTLNYYWDFGDGTTSYLPYPFHNYAVPGNYVICLTVFDQGLCNSSTCDSTSRLTQQMSANGVISTFTVLAPNVGIAENHSVPMETRLFPNPMTEISSVAFNSSLSANGKIEVVNILGSTVLSENVVITRGNNEFRLNTSLLNNGLYYVNIIAENRTLSTVKAIK